MSSVNNPRPVIHPAQWGPPVSGYPAIVAVPVVMNRIGKTRNPWAAWLLTVVTFGVYGLWWYYTINRELRDYDTQINVQPGIAVCAVSISWIVFGLGLITTIVSIAKTGGRIGQAQRFAGSRDRCSALLGVLLTAVGFGVVYYQSQINKVWDCYGNPSAGTLRP